MQKLRVLYVTEQVQQRMIQFAQSALGKGRWMGKRSAPFARGQVKFQTPNNN